MTTSPKRSYDELALLAEAQELRVWEAIQRRWKYPCLASCQRDQKHCVRIGNQFQATIPALLTPVINREDMTRADKTDEEDILAKAIAIFSAKTQATARTVATVVEPGNVLAYGEIVKAQGGGGALAMARQRDKLYAASGVEYVVPLHRMMSSQDLYAQVDGKRGTGIHGRVYKVGLRELEGAYPKGKEPSKVGLPPQTKPAKTWPPSSEDTTRSPSIAASVCDAMVKKLTLYAAANCIDCNELWKHGDKIMAKSKSG